MNELKGFLPRKSLELRSKCLGVFLTALTGSWKRIKQKLGFTNWMISFLKYYHQYFIKYIGFLLGFFQFMRYFNRKIVKFLWYTLISEKLVSFIIDIFCIKDINVVSIKENYCEHLLFMEGPLILEENFLILTYVCHFHAK